MLYICISHLPQDMKTKSKEEIEAKIKELIKDPDGFTSDNYGSEAADNGYFEVHFSKSSTEETLKAFAEFILGKEIF